MRPARFSAVLSSTALPLLAAALALSPARAAAAPTPVQACGAAAAAALPAGMVPGVYRGALGGQSVLLELAARPASASSDTDDRYAYMRFGVDLALDRGRVDRGPAGSPLLLAEYRQGYPDPHPAACFTLRPGAGGRLTGRWRSLGAGGSVLPVALTRLSVAALPRRLQDTPAVLKLRQDDPFTYVKLNHAWVPLGAGSVREPLTGLIYPRAAGGSARLNRALADRQLQLAADILDCRAGVQASGVPSGWTPDDLTVDTRISWRSPHLLGLSGEVAEFCGGAHPNSWTQGLTLDARTGGEVTLTGAPGSLWPGLSAARLQALYLTRYTDPADVDSTEAAGCREALGGEEGRGAGGGLPYTLTLTKAGLEIWPNFLPHVIQACADTITLPYAALRGLANPGSPYFRDVYSR